MVSNSSWRLLARGVGLCSVAMLMSACVSLDLGGDSSSNANQGPEYKGQLLWPQPPDQPRFTFEAVLRSPADIGANERTLIDTLSGRAAHIDEPAFVKPASILAKLGRIYVADTAAKSIVVFDIPKRKVYRFGHVMPGLLARPAGMAMDNEHLVYVADSKLAKVFVYDHLGLFLHTIGDDALVRPVGVAVSGDGERIYVVDRADNESPKHQVVIYDKNGKRLKVIGKRGGGQGEFNVPLQATVAADGTLYVLDSGNFRVQAFDREGNYLRSFGQLGKTLGSFARPRGISTDKDGNVYISDATLNNVQMFNPKGELLLTVGATSIKNNPGQFSLVNGVAVDETGRLYVVDQVFNKVEVFRRLSDAEGKDLLHKVKR